MSWANGDSYTGEWAHGKHNGEGIFQWSVGGKYEGQWKDNLMHGKGHLVND